MSATQDGRRESQKDEDRRRYEELLQEFRVILPGVQVLFAFLLTVPFAARFEALDSWERRGFAVALAASATAAILFLAPTAFHHLTDRSDRRARIELAIRLKLVSTGFLGVAISAGIFVVVNFVYGTAEGVAALIAVTVVWLGAWYLLPLAHDLRDD